MTFVLMKKNTAKLEPTNSLGVMTLNFLCHGWVLMLIKITVFRILKDCQDSPHFQLEVSTTVQETQ